MSLIRDPASARVWQKQDTIRHNPDLIAATLLDLDERANGGQAGGLGSFLRQLRQLAHHSEAISSLLSSMFSIRSNLLSRGA